ncbi:MAG: hypothetical protein QOJ15_1875 [Bradyrhizobium sp.]|jgi:hypothetical protein|nr:hypothetical protein [Bradyrhizobium sp.]
MVSSILWDQSARGGVHTSASINASDSMRIPLTQLVSVRPQIDTKV